MNINIKLDGIDHINIYSKGKTILGKQLSNMYYFSFNYDGLDFNSVEQAWHYYKFIKINPNIANQIISMNNIYEIKKYAKKYNNETSEYVQSNEFRNLIQKIIETRLHKDSKLCLILRNSVLPFKHYYTFGNENSYKVINESIKYDWLIEIITNFRIKLWFDYLDDLLHKYGYLCVKVSHNDNNDLFKNLKNSIYIGRNSKFKNITYGNPFLINSDIKKYKYKKRELYDIEVAYIVMKYRSYLINEIYKNPKEWYGALDYLKQKSLECFCNEGKNNRNDGGRFCHGLILKHISKNLDEFYIKNNLMSKL